MGAQTKIALTGFIGNTHDALIVFEACRRGLLPRATARLSEAERQAIKSGDIFVFNEEESQIKRWTDGKRWSPSRILNNFLIYREIKADGRDGEEGEEGAGDSSKTEIEDVDELAPSTSTPSTLAHTSSYEASSSSLQPSPDANSASSRAVDPKFRNITGGLELLPNRKEGGLIKKTISVAGLHMISYYTAEEVIAGHLRQPGSIPELANIDISHPFLMAQFFRHPPQVTFDADQMPHFAGITDDEPMVRRPALQPRKKKDTSEQLTPSIREASLPGPPHMAFQNISHDPPFLANQPSRTSLSPIGQHHRHPQHMVSSPIPSHEQTSTSLLSHMSTDMNPLLPPVRPGVGSRSSTSLSAASTSDTSSPRIRSSISHTNRHEPYRIPVPRHRYSVTDLTSPMHQELMNSPSYYPRQGSLPNPGMDHYRPAMYQTASERFTTPQAQNAGHYSAPLAASNDNSNAEYHYTLAGSEALQHTHWQNAQQNMAHSDSPRSFYSAASSLQTGQLANGEPPRTMMPHPSTSASIYSTGNTPQPDYSQPTLYGGPDFYGRPRVSMRVSQNHTTRPWYGQVVEEQQSSHTNGGNLSQPQHLIAPQAVQHLAGLLPETGYSPLLPSSAAYASEPLVQEHPQTESLHVKHEPYSPGKHCNYGHPQGAYITAPPPPSYTHPNRAYREDIKPSQSSFPQQEAEHYQAPEYPPTGAHEPVMEDPRDS